MRELPKKIDETLTVNLSGPDGNAFCILANVIRIMQEHGCSEEEIEAYKKEATSSDYDHLLETSGKIVNLETI